MFDMNAAERIRYMLGCMKVMPAYEQHKNFAAVTKPAKERKVSYGAVIRAHFAGMRQVERNKKKGH